MDCGQRAACRLSSVVVPHCGSSSSLEPLDPVFELTKPHGHLVHVHGARAEVGFDTFSGNPDAAVALMFDFREPFSREKSSYRTLGNAHKSRGFHDC